MSVNITSLKEFLTWLENKGYYWDSIKDSWFDESSKPVDQKTIIHEYLRDKLKEE